MARKVQEKADAYIWGKKKRINSQFMNSKLILVNVYFCFLFQAAFLPPSPPHLSLAVYQGVKKTKVLRLSCVLHSSSIHQMTCD